jgi:hypothetical protein
MFHAVIHDYMTCQFKSTDKLRMTTEWPVSLDNTAFLDTQHISRRLITNIIVREKMTHEKVKHTIFAARLLSINSHYFSLSSHFCI